MKNSKEAQIMTIKDLNKLHVTLEAITFRNYTSDYFHGPIKPSNRLWVAKLQWSMQLRLQQARNGDRLFCVSNRNTVLSYCFWIVRQCREISRMIWSLTEIQRLAYQLDEERSLRSVLRFSLEALKFSVRYSEIFSQLKHNSPRNMFGAPYHAVTCHMPEMYRYVSLRSIVTEQNERIFHDLKWVYYH